MFNDISISETFWKMEFMYYFPDKSRNNTANKTWYQTFHEVSQTEYKKLNAEQKKIINKIKMWQWEKENIKKLFEKEEMLALILFWGKARGNQNLYNVCYKYVLENTAEINESGLAKRTPHRVGYYF